MKQSKHHRHSVNEGVYLADLSSGAVDPQVAALYFSTNKKQVTGRILSVSSGCLCRCLFFMFTAEHAGLDVCKAYFTPKFQNIIVIIFLNIET